MIDLGAVKSGNAIKIVWGQPFASEFTVQHGDFVGPEDLSQRLPTDWHAFPREEIESNRRGAQVIRLSDDALRVRYIRVRLDESSKSRRKPNDVRDRLGFAIRELYVGTIDVAGRFHDLIRHAPNHKQTTIYVSSTDPWPREIDRDEQTEQPDRKSTRLNPSHV